MWAENRFIIFIPVLDPDFRQLRAADPPGWEGGLQKASQRGAVAASPGCNELPFSDPAAAPVCAWHAQYKVCNRNTCKI